MCQNRIQETGDRKQRAEDIGRRTDDGRRRTDGYEHQESSIQLADNISMFFRQRFGLANSGRKVKINVVQETKYKNLNVWEFVLATEVTENTEI